MVLFGKGVLAEEESILDQATVLGTCSSEWCVNPQNVIGPGFKSKWHDWDNDKVDRSNEILIDLGEERTPVSLFLQNVNEGASR